MTAKRRRHDVRQTLRRCRKLLECRGVADTDLTTLVDRVAAYRQRPLQLLGVRMHASHPSGFWLETDAVDIVGYEADTSPTHRQHIIAHELSHILWEHRGPFSVDTGQAALLFPDLDLDLVRSVLGRQAAYPDAQEFEAEIMAWLIVRDRCRPPGEPFWMPLPETTDLARRLERSFTIVADDKRG